MNKIQWESYSGAFRFKVCGKSGALLPASSWASEPCGHDGGVGSVAPLLALIEDEQAHVQTDNTVLVASHDVAQLSDMECAQLGLPGAARLRLKIRGKGVITSPSFRVVYQLLKLDGRPIPGLQRKGALLEVGGAQYLLLDPLFSIIQALEDFEEIPCADRDRRMYQWGCIRAMLPQDAVLDDQLKAMTVVRADCVTADIRGGNYQLEPRFLRKKEAETDFISGTDEDPEPSLLLPDAQQKAFSKQFSEYPDANAQYALGSGWYVLVPEKLRPTMGVIRKLQTASANERVAFITNPGGYLHSKLPDIDHEDSDFLFEETTEFLSARIKYLGVWEPKVCAYVHESGVSWLPPEEVRVTLVTEEGVRILPQQDLPAVIETIEKAIQDGTIEVTIDGQTIPATKETLERLKKVEQGVREEVATAEPVPGSSAVLVPIIDDNLEAGAYAKRIEGERTDLPVTPEGFNGHLYPHQEQGVHWLIDGWKQGLPGVLLADDMGLGKTIQTLMFLGSVRQAMMSGKHPVRPCLIIAPTGLLKNWQAEAEMHIPGILDSCFPAFGQGLRQLRGMSVRERMEEFSRQDWVLTTYETLRDSIQLFLNTHWAVTCFDEAQKIKNPASRMTEMAKSLETDFTIMLTGTPVENSLSDLWSIMDGCYPGFLGSLQEFRDRYEKPSKQNPEVCRELKARLCEEEKPALMLRRLKDDHLKGLPEKITQVLPEKMCDFQAEAYSKVVDSAQKISNKRGSMFKILQDLRTVSLLPDELGPSGLTDEIMARSARLRRCLSILDEIAQRGEKALIFLESLNLQEALVPYLQHRYRLSSPPMRISGKVGGASRKKRVDEFQSGEDGTFDVMLLSPKAGGVGLTLTAANHVIHLSRWWNPAVEDQCTDRVYRIGQSKDVMVYYPQAVHPTFGEHSFDVALNGLLERKRHLSRAVLAPLVDENETQDLFGSTVRMVQ